MNYRWMLNLTTLGVSSLWFYAIVSSYAWGADSTAVRNYLDSLPKLTVIEAEPATLQEIPNLRAGLTGTQQSGGKFINNQAELSLLKTYSDLTWPGALVQGASIGNSRFAPIHLDRSGGRVVITTNFVRRSQDQADYSHELKTMTLAGTNQAIKDMIRKFDASDSAATVAYQVVTAGSQLEAMVKLGIAYDGVGVSAKVDAKANFKTMEQTYFVKYVQEFYRVGFDLTDNAHPFIAPTVSLDDVKRFAKLKNPMLYVSEVIYGRILLLSFTTSLKETDVEASVNATTAQISGSAEAEIHSKLERMKVGVLSVGSTGKVTTKLLDIKDGATMLKNLQDYISAGAKFDSNENPGTAIAIKMRYVGSTSPETGPRALAIAQLVTDNSPEIVDLSTKDNCDFEPYYVFDGPDGGTVKTDAILEPGDTLKINASGKNWSGVLATDPYDPRGWYTWDKGPVPSGGFPIKNIQPFALIARLGDTAREGNSAIETQGYENNNPADRGTWFYVGQALGIKVGGRATLGEYPGYGRLYLATNDSEPYNGDPKYKFKVSVCIEPKNPREL
ncbi:MAG: thiol-activated cytolysin family protein [Desulfuromusa sp.]|nr:thiol-activated cytolysin family protein [Desulfuromusa sp.]